MSAEWDDLARLAEAATPGPWVAEYSGEQGNCVLPHDAQSTREAVAVTRLFHQQADAEFIAAANPATILRLIEENRNLRTTVDADLEYQRRLEARLAAVEAEHEALADSLRVEAAQIVSQVSDEPMRMPTHLDEMLGIDPNDTAMRSAARAVQAQRQRMLLARRLAAVEALADVRNGTVHADNRDPEGVIRVSDLRAVLSAAPTDTTKET